MTVERNKARASLLVCEDEHAAVLRQKEQLRGLAERKEREALARVVELERRLSVGVSEGEGGGGEAAAASLPAPVRRGAGRGSARRSSGGVGV